LGHEIDDLSSTFSETNIVGGGYNLGYTQPFNPSFDKGNGDIDIRHRLVLAPIYELPWYKGRRGVKGEALGGWQIAGIYTVRSGAPFTIYDSTNNLSGYNVPRYAPSSAIRKWKYTKAIASDNTNNLYTLVSGLPAGTPISNSALGGISDWGPYPASTTQRNAFTGPGAWNLDLAVSKKFPVTEKVNLELRAEGFDILNHHNLYVYQAVNDQANYLNADGTPGALSVYAKKGGINGSTSEERRFGQFAVKVNF
jgi:hypothetical protein